MAERGATRATPPPTPENWVVITHTDVVIVCLICGFFVMGCVVIYFHQCADRLFAGERIVGHRRSPPAAARGLGSDVIDNFPRFRYSDVKALMIGKGALECAVCLNEFADDDEKLRLLPSCCHVFHRDCIDQWLAAQVTCPVCRANLIPDSGEFRRDSVQSHDPVPDDVTEEIVEINSASREHITGKFPRSHSTGHSLIQTGGDCNRFTLRLPEEVKNRMVTACLAGNPSHSPILSGPL